MSGTVEALLLRMCYVFVEVVGIKIGAIGAWAPAVGLCGVVASEDTSLDQ